jgi:hypothetical protein
MTKIKHVQEVNGLAEAVNLLRHWLQQPSNDSNIHSPQHDCYKAIIHEASVDECGIYHGELCVHGLWNEGDRLGFCHGVDNQGWFGRSEYDGTIVLNAGATFVKWAGYHGFIIDHRLATEAAVWESRNSWWQPKSRCSCSLCT